MMCTVKRTLLNSPDQLVGAVIDWLYGSTTSAREGAIGRGLDWHGTPTKADGVWFHARVPEYITVALPLYPIPSVLTTFCMYHTSQCPRACTAVLYFSRHLVLFCHLWTK